ncbi:MAG: hypothetical protein C0390_00980 [Syntrophus sp. (in: bacteria)]|nr:hypothetical protein [Syntrophus sp. (in: bacteria)]
MAAMGKARLIYCLIVFSTTFFPVFAGAGNLKIGVISNKPVDMIKNCNPMARYLECRLKGLGITGVKVVVAKDIPEMVQWVKKEVVDIVFETAFATVVMREEAGMIPKLLVWKKGVKQYVTLFFVRNDSPMTNLKDLAGKTLAFESPNSTSAYLIPKAELRLLGLTVIPLEGRARKNAVNYVFAGRDINQTFQVIQKKADAGAFNSNDWDELPEKIKAELKIIHESKPIIRFIASFHPSLSGKLQEALINHLVQMDKEPDGIKALQSASRISKIERLTDEDLKSLDYVKNLMKVIE